MHFLCLGGALGGATVGLYQNGGYDESMPMRLLSMTYGSAIVHLYRSDVILAESANH